MTSARASVAWTCALGDLVGCDVGVCARSAFAARQEVHGLPGVLLVAHQALRPCRNGADPTKYAPAHGAPCIHSAARSTRRGVRIGCRVRRSAPRRTTRGPDRVLRLRGCASYAPAAGQRQHCILKKVRW